MFLQSENREKKYCWVPAVKPWVVVSKVKGSNPDLSIGLHGFQACLTAPFEDDMTACPACRSA